MRNDSLKEVSEILEDHKIAISNFNCALFKNKQGTDLMVDLWDLTLENDVDQYYKIRFDSENFDKIMLDQITVSKWLGEVSRFKFIFEIERFEDDGASSRVNLTKEAEKYQENFISTA